MELNEEIIPKFIQGINRKIQQKQKWTSDEAAKILAKLGTWNKK